jgi:hypothetical protein
MAVALPVLGAVAGGVIASKGAGKAADVQAGAAREATAEQRRQFDITQEQFGVQQEQLAPFREAGLSALEQQQGLLGLGGLEAQKAAFAAFGESPGQQFLRGEQEKALLRNQSAIGGLGGGNVRRELQQQAFGRAQTGLQRRLANLAGLSGAGRQAIVNPSQEGLLRQQTAGQIGQFGMQAAQARASGILGQTQALQRGVGDISQILGQQFTPQIQPTQPIQPGINLQQPFQGLTLSGGV